MKKIFLYILAGSFYFSACKKDDDVPTYIEPKDITTQNTYDDKAIKKFMDENYLDAQGNIRSFKDIKGNNEKKLSELNPITLPSGTIYIIRDGVQPTPADSARTINSTDIIKIMGRAYSYLAVHADGNTAFQAKTTFLNTIDEKGIPTIDPAYYYVKKSILEAGTTDAAKKAKYYQIYGFREALQQFKAFNNLSSEAPYNLQGVIIVPSRAAFARNPHYPYLNMSYRNRSFVFNFQIYGRESRPIEELQTTEQQQ